MGAKDVYRTREAAPGDPHPKAMGTSSWTEDHGQGNEPVHGQKHLEVDANGVLLQPSTDEFPSIPVTIDETGNQELVPAGAKGWICQNPTAVPIYFSFAPVPFPRGIRINPGATYTHAVHYKNGHKGAVYARTEQGGGSIEVEVLAWFNDA